MSEQLTFPSIFAPMVSAPKDATEVLGLRRGGDTLVVHWASDLSGEEQLPFQGWFTWRVSYYAKITDLVGWKPIVELNEEATDV